MTAHMLHRQTIQQGGVQAYEGLQTASKLKQQYLLLPAKARPCCQAAALLPCAGGRPR